MRCRYPDVDMWEDHVQKHEIFSNPAEMITVDTRYGPLLVPNQVDDTIGRFLVRYGEWAWLEAEFIAGVAGDGARILDGGAFLGTFGLGVAMAGKPGFICFVEANPEIEDSLATNVRGKLDIPFQTVPAMIAGTGVAPRLGHVDPTNMGSTSYAEDADPGDATPPPGRSVTLRELRAQHGRFDLVKLDLEGMELQALDSDAAYLATGETALWIECNEHRRSLDVARRLLAWGLSVYYFAFPSFNPDNVNADPEPIYPFAYEAGLLAAPQSMPVLSAALAVKGCVLKRVRSVYDLKQAMWRTPRWGLPEWQDTAGPELVALVGRTLRGERFDLFLGVAAAGATPADEATGSETGQLRLLLEQERAIREAAEAGLEQARGLATARADEVSRVEMRLAATEEERRSATESSTRLTNELAILRRQMQEKARQAEEAIEHLAASEAELASTSSRALGHLASLGKSRDRVDALERDLDDERKQFQAALLKAKRDSLRLQEHIVALDDELRQVRQSSMWRFSAPARSFLSARPRLRAALRRSVATMGLLRLRP